MILGGVVDVRKIKIVLQSHSKSSRGCFQRKPFNFLTMATLTSKDLKILYIHGLESGPHGRKIQILKEDFDVYAADMQMSVWKISRKNSFCRKAFNQHIVPFLIILLSLICGILGDGVYQYIAFGIVGLYVLILMIFRKKWMSLIVSASFESCLEIQQKLEFQIVCIQHSI